MTLDQLSNLFNVLAIGVVVLMSAYVSHRHRRPFFESWTLAYLLNFALMVANAIAPLDEVPPLGAWLQLLLAQAANYYFLEANCRFVGGPCRRWPFLGLLSLLIVCGGMLALGVPAIVAVVPVLLVNAAIKINLAAAFLPSRHGPIRHGWAWVGIPVLLSGLWPLTYPAFSHGGGVWLGYTIAAVLHLSVGIGMVIYLLEETLQALFDKNEALLQLDRLKTSFLGTVSHELRTPLTAIKGAAWLLETGAEGDAPEQKRMLARMVQTHSDRLMRLVSDLLDFSKMEAGHLAYQMESDDLGGLIEEAVDGVRPKFEEQGIALSLDRPGGPMMSSFDSDKVMRVLFNLLSNAAKFTPTGGSVTVQAERQAGAIQVSVEDSGIGIAPEHHVRIFSKFYQVDAKDTRAAEGAGLGLPICKAIIEEGHRGRIWVESAPGQGSRFVFTLPDPVPSAVGAR